MLNSRLMRAKKHVHRSWCCSQGSIWCRGLIQTGLRPSLAVNSLQKCSHGHFNLTQDHNIFSTSCTSESNPGTRNFTNRTLTAGRQKRTVVRLSHDETWKSETEPRQYIQLSRLSKGMTRHEKPCYETRHMSQDSTTASSKRSKLSTPIHLSPLLKKVLVTGSIARSATCRYLIYSEADFEVFRHARATRCTDWGWNLAWRRTVPSFMLNFTPIGATTRLWDPKNWNFYSDMTKMWNINALVRFSQNLQSLYLILGCVRC